ncbi:MAG: hypothetical protein JRJ12_12185 [Deltaproteobacteria bacterium]|nr:hypothetical protein [Deltaproteobacteria bacterium]MBW2072293.1 hypothetical protein [Deltaproteobacteria bacterium]
MTRENRKVGEDWQNTHRRYFQCGGIIIQVESGLPITDTTFQPKFRLFQVEGPGEDTISIRHHFSLPDFKGHNLGTEVYRRSPWAVYKKGDSWVYVGISPAKEDDHLHRVAVFNHDHTRALIYNEHEEVFRNGGLHSLTLFPTDQILLARVLADRQGCLLHACGVIIDAKGVLFVGHSDAGKSTMATLLKGRAELLCDDRMIVRRWKDGFRIHGTWSHGDVTEVSANSAPLDAIFFLEQARENSVIPVDDRKEVVKRLLACVIRPLVTAAWWEKMLDLVGMMAREVPCYVLRFEKSGKVVEILGDRLASR